MANTNVNCKSITKEKLMENIIQQQNILTFGSQDSLEMNYKIEI